MSSRFAGSVAVPGPADLNSITMASTATLPTFAGLCELAGTYIAVSAPMSLS